MVAGIPGTGIGGVFYLLLTFLMPFHEVWLVVRGQSSWARWKCIAIQLGNASGVLLSLTAVGWGVRRGVDAVSAVLASHSTRFAGVQALQSAASVSFSWLTFGVLGFVTTGAVVLGATLALYKRIFKPNLASISTFPE